MQRLLIWLHTVNIYDIKCVDMRGVFNYIQIFVKIIFSHQYLRID